MSKRGAARGSARTADAAQRTVDSFQNLSTLTGIGAGNASTSGGYGLNPVTRNRLQLEWAYRGSWIVGIAIDAPADDMTREGAEVRSDDDPSDLKKLDREARRLQIWNRLADTVRWGRLYGGAIGLFLIDGQDPATPLRLDTVHEGQFRGIMPLDRWSVWPTVTDLVTEMGPELGLPRFYDMMLDTGTGVPSMRIHHSRVIRMEGIELPYWQRITENYWGLSVIERLWDRLVAFDSTTQGAAQLVYKAHLRTYKVKGLREIVAMGGPALTGLKAQLDFTRRSQSNEAMSIVEGDDEFDVHQYAFSGLSDMLLQFGQQISGALEIPLVRLFGQSPAGLNSTGESDLRNYYDGIKQKQEARLRVGVEKMYELLYRSTFGRPPGDEFTVEFQPLWQMSDAERATVAQTTTTAITDVYDRQIIDRATALQELKQLSMVTGVFSNISDEAIQEAEDEPPPAPDAAVPDPGSLPPAAEPGEDAPSRAAVREAAARDR